MRRSVPANTGCGSAASTTSSPACGSTPPYRWRPAIAWCCGIPGRIATVAGAAVLDTMPDAEGAGRAGPAAPTPRGPDPRRSAGFAPRTWRSAPDCRSNPRSQSVTDAGGERAGDWFVDASVATELRGRAAACVTDHHAVAPTERGIPFGGSRSRVGGDGRPTRIVARDHSPISSSTAGACGIEPMRATPPTPTRPAGCSRPSASIRSHLRHPTTSRSRVHSSARGALIELDGIYFTADAVAAARAMVDRRVAREGFAHHRRRARRARVRRASTWSR